MACRDSLASLSKNPGQKQQTMLGTIKSWFPGKKKETYVVVVQPEDGTPPIKEEMNGVADKSELPKKGDKVELVRSFPTWKVK